MRNENRMWELRQSATPDTLDLHIYGTVEGDWYNWWGDLQRSETSANHFRQELEKHPNAAQINVYINSNGGSVFEGTAIYNQLRRHPAHKTVYVDGFACSIASVIAMAGDTVVMPRNTMMMVHNMLLGVCGNAAELRKAADDLDTINAAGRQAYLTKSNGKITEEQLIALMDAETWLTAEQCIAYGLADEYAEADADMTQAAEQLTASTKNLEQRIKLRQMLNSQLRQLTDVPNLDTNPAPTDGAGEPVNKLMQLFERL